MFAGAIFVHALLCHIMIKRQEIGKCLVATEIIKKQNECRYWVSCIAIEMPKTEGLFFTSFYTYNKTLSFS